MHMKLDMVCLRKEVVDLLVIEFVKAKSAEAWGQMTPLHVAPNELMMVLKAKVPRRLYPAANLYFVI